MTKCVCRLPLYDAWCLRFFTVEAILECIIRSDNVSCDTIVNTYVIFHISIAVSIFLFFYSYIYLLFLKMEMSLILVNRLLLVLVTSDVMLSISHMQIFSYAIYSRTGAIYTIYTIT